MGDQRIDQRAGRVAGGGMHDQSLRLVDDDDLVVLEHHLKRDGLGRDRGVLRRRQLQSDGVAGVDAVTGIADRGAADRDAAGQDQRLVARARQLGDAGGQHAVEPLAGLFGGDHEFFPAPLDRGHERSGRR